jgi:hypothetical protein
MFVFINFYLALRISLLPLTSTYYGVNVNAFGQRVSYVIQRGFEYSMSQLIIVSRHERRECTCSATVIVGYPSRRKLLTKLVVANAANPRAF